MDYIKKLRACIRAFQELDVTHVREKDELSKELEEERQSRHETGKHPMCIHSTHFSRIEVLSVKSSMSTGPQDQSGHVCLRTTFSTPMQRRK